MGRACFPNTALPPSMIQCEINVLHADRMRARIMSKTRLRDRTTRGRDVRENLHNAEASWHRGTNKPCNCTLTSPPNQLLAYHFANATTASNAARLMSKSSPLVSNSQWNLHPTGARYALSWRLDQTSSHSTNFRTVGFSLYQKLYPGTCICICSNTLMPAHRICS